MASFLQRKGRAGRVRAMRPWTVVVTSAYGRDRWAFQHAEELFSPLLPPLHLPVENCSRTQDPGSLCNHGLGRAAVRAG